MAEDYGRSLLRRVWPDYWRERKLQRELDGLREDLRAMEWRDLARPRDSMDGLVTKRAREESDG